MMILTRPTMARGPRHSVLTNYFFQLAACKGTSKPAPAAIDAGEPHAGPSGRSEPRGSPLDRRRARRPRAGSRPMVRRSPPGSGRPGPPRLARSLLLAVCAVGAAEDPHLARLRQAAQLQNAGRQRGQARQM